MTAPATRSALILHAPNVHAGGGLVLLRCLLGAAHDRELAWMNLDSRARDKLGLQPDAPCRWYGPTFANRFAAEIELRNRALPSHAVLCFGSLPPLFRLPAHVAVFVQNRLLVDAVPLDGFNRWVKLRIAAERTWLRRLSRNADRYIVQTPAMAALLERRCAGRATVDAIPFAQHAETVSRNARAPAAGRVMRYDFVYVASGDAHKNHATLVRAWRALAAEGIFPTLCLTLDPVLHPALWDAMADDARRHGLRIENATPRDQDEIAALYRSARALIFPSTVESLGLPLIEARRHGLAVLAPELDFVRDVLDPEESFDPGSAVSIARAVKRFLGRPERALQLSSARQFLDAVLEPGSYAGHR